MQWRRLRVSKKKTAKKTKKTSAKKATHKTKHSSSHKAEHESHHQKHSHHTHKKPVKKEQFGWQSIVGIVLIVIAIIGAVYLFTGTDQQKETNDVKDLGSSGNVDMQQDILSFPATQLSYEVKDDGTFAVNLQQTGETLTVEQSSVLYLKELFSNEGYQPTDEEVLQEAIVREALYYNADKSVDDQKAVQEIIQNSAFQQRLQESGQNPQAFIATYEDEIVKDYMIQQYFNRNVIESIPTQNARVTNHILVCYEGTELCSENRTKAEALELAKEIKMLAEANNTLEGFEQLAKERSDGPSGQVGGDLGTVTPGTMVPAFENATFALDINEISDPVETQFGYHIIRVDGVEKVTNNQVAMEALTEIKQAILATAVQG